MTEDDQNEQAHTGNQDTTTTVPFDLAAKSYSHTKCITYLASVPLTCIFLMPDRNVRTRPRGPLPCHFCPSAITKNEALRSFYNIQEKNIYDAECA